jgi:hypothetical protein
MAKGNVFSGARARFKIDGVKVGYATGCSGSEEITYEPVEVLDNIEVEEYVPIAYRVTFTASRVRIIGETVKKAGWFPKNAGNVEEHLKNILTASDKMQCTLEATRSDGTVETFMTLEQVKLTSHNWSVNARGIVGEDMTFVAVRMRDESETS